MRVYVCVCVHALVCIFAFVFSVFVCVGVGVFVEDSRELLSEVIEVFFVAFLLVSANRMLSLRLRSSLQAIAIHHRCPCTLRFKA